MLNTAFAPWPVFSEAEIEAVQQVLRSGRVNYWTGSECREFEREFAHWCGTTHAIAVANGTVALDLALRGLGIGAGDEVVVTPRTFMASASCVVNAGAIPVFADVDADSGNISAATISRVLTPRTRAIVCVHLAGWPCDMDPIMALAREHGIKVIEDCAQAHGARYKGRSVGSIGDVGAWSFCQDKIMTTGGEGGMITINDDALWRTMWSYKDHGKSYAAVYEKQHPPGFRWLHESFGTNWRMTEMQAVIGRIQLQMLPEWTAARHAHASALYAALLPFADDVIRLPEFSFAGQPGASSATVCGSAQEQSSHAQYKFYAYVRPERLADGWSRDRIVEAINAEGVPCYQGTCSEVYLEKAFDSTGWRPSSALPTTQELGQTSLMFLVHPTLTQDQIQKRCEAIAKVLSQASARHDTEITHGHDTALL